VQPFEYLERDFGRWAGVDNVVACSSGSAALHLALESLRLPLGSGVILPSFTMIAVARAVSLAGLSPVFVDCTPDLLLDPDAVDGAASTCPHVRAMIAVHTYGRAAPMAALIALATKFDLAVIEDAAEAHGVPPHPDSDAYCVSFYRNKIVGAEEGGAVAFRCPEVAALGRQLRCLGFTPEHDFRHVPRGCNYRLANSLARLILDSLRNVDANLCRRRRIEQWYEAACPAEWKMPPRDVVWTYDVRLPGLKRPQQTAIVRALNAAGIAARHGFFPLHLQDEYIGSRYFGGGKTARAADEVFYLPAWDVSESDVERAFSIIRSHVQPNAIPLPATVEST
jgi:perosamine synthetase